MMKASPFAGAPPLSAAGASSYFGLISCIPLTSLRRSLQNGRLASTNKNRSSQKFLVSANANAPQRINKSRKEVIMVDPIEAKRLAARQMQEIQAKEKIKRRHQAEALNGALAMIGLTAGLVAEGQTGKGILGQLAGYWAAFTSLFSR